MVEWRKARGPHHDHGLPDVRRARSQAEPSRTEPATRKTRIKPGCSTPTQPEFQPYPHVLNETGVSAGGRGVDHRASATCLDQTRSGSIGRGTRRAERRAGTVIHLTPTAAASSSDAIKAGQTGPLPTQIEWVPPGNRNPYVAVGVRSALRAGHVPPTRSPTLASPLITETPWLGPSSLARSRDVRKRIPRGSQRSILPI